ncbi:MAG TPA: hypothetical protein VM261_04475 [Kofleriaceae bacterium]|nr:hypothetical protein [Kofleriaceae bacterium]
MQSPRLVPACRLASACVLVTVVACTADSEPESDPTLTARFSTATHDQLGITLFTAADLIDVDLYAYMVVMRLASSPTCEPMIRAGDVTFIGCGGSSGGTARAENSSLTWPRAGELADPARPEILTATDLVLGATMFDGQVVRSSPAGAVDLREEVSVDVTMRYEHPWANSDSALQLTELPDGRGVHYTIADTSRMFVDGVGRAAVTGDVRIVALDSLGATLDGWVELRGAETLRATFDSLDECTALSIDGESIAPLCNW